VRSEVNRGHLAFVQGKHHITIPMAQREIIVRNARRPSWTEQRSGPSIADRDHPRHIAIFPTKNWNGNSFARSGPGGQNVNKVSGVPCSCGFLPAPLKQQFAGVPPEKTGLRAHGRT